ncbi:MAG: hypothetical protein R2789_16155 [Microthrixaceae bacterium]
MATNRAITLSVVVGLGCLCVGTYASLDATLGWALAAPMLGAGLALSGVGLVLSGERVDITRYRPDPGRGRRRRWRPVGSSWRERCSGWPETTRGDQPVAIAARLAHRSGDAMCAVLLGALPAVLAPRLPETALPAGRLAHP